MGLHVPVEHGLPELRRAPHHVLLHAAVGELRHPRAQLLQGQAAVSGEVGRAGPGTPGPPRTHPAEGCDQGQQRSRDAVLVQGGAVLRAPGAIRTPPHSSRTFPRLPRALQRSWAGYPSPCPQQGFCPADPPPTRASPHTGAARHAADTPAASPAGSSSSCGRRSRTAGGPGRPGSAARAGAAPGPGSGGRRAPSGPAAQPGAAGMRGTGHMGAALAIPGREQGPPGAGVRAPSTGHLEASWPGVPRRLGPLTQEHSRWGRGWGWQGWDRWGTGRPRVHGQYVGGAAGRPRGPGAGAGEQLWGAREAPTACRPADTTERRAAGGPLSHHFFKK